MSRQSTSLRKTKKETRRAEDFIAEANASVTKPRQRKSTETYISELGITEEKIAKARDADGLSWRDVAKVCGLPNPGAARKAYEILTGRLHDASVMTARRAPRGSWLGARRNAYLAPEWNNETEMGEITEAIEGHVISVKRLYGNIEEIPVLSVLFFLSETASGNPCELAVEFTSGHRDSKGNSVGIVANRTVNVASIVEVR